jgi:hypothetical protein
MGCEYAAYVELLFPNATVLGMMQLGADKEGSEDDACHSRGGIVVVRRALTRNARSV